MPTRTPQQDRRGVEAAGGNIRYEVVDVTAGTVTDAAAGSAWRSAWFTCCSTTPGSCGQRLLLGEQSQDFLLTMEVNSIGPMLVAREFRPG